MRRWVKAVILLAFLTPILVETRTFIGLLGFDVSFGESLVVGLMVFIALYALVSIGLRLGGAQDNHV